MPKCVIDGREIDVPAGTTVIQAGLMAGIEIPHFCWHPDLPVDGNCRMYLVEIERRRDDAAVLGQRRHGRAHDE